MEIGSIRAASATTQSTLGEISWLLPNGPELAGSAARVRVSAETNDTEQAFSGRVVSGLGLGARLVKMERKTRCVRVRCPSECTLIDLAMR